MSELLFLGVGLFLLELLDRACEMIDREYHQQVTTAISERCPFSSSQNPDRIDDNRHHPERGSASNRLRVMTSKMPARTTRLIGAYVTLISIITSDRKSR